MKIAKPVRQKHRCVQEWNGTRQSIFPLLCPVREVDWTPKWEPKLVISNSGLIEQECLFVEPDQPEDAIWIVSKYEPDLFNVEMYRVVPGLTVGKFAISLEHEYGKKKTRAVVIYEQTALGTDGEKIVNNFTSDHFASFMQEFRLAIEHYLTTGKVINGNELMMQESRIHH